MVTCLHYFANAIYFLTSEMPLTSWEGLQASAKKEGRPFEKVWTEETKRIRKELQTYSSAPNLSYLQTLQPFLQEWEDEWFRNVTNENAFAGWGETQEGTEREEWKNAMDRYWRNVESITVRIVDDPKSLADLPPHTHAIFKSMSKKVGLLRHMCLSATYGTVFCELPLPNKMVLKDIHALYSQSAQGIMTPAIKEVGGSDPDSDIGGQS